MDPVAGLAEGLANALTIEHLLYALVGCIVGTLVGVLPGLGPAATVALLIPLSFTLPVTGAFIMLAAIFYGAAYGGRITAILMKVPGEPSSAVTMLDGYPLATQGRAGAALSISAVASFVGGMIATVGLIVAAPFLARLAVRFGPPEYFALMLLALAMVAGLITKSVTKGLVSVLIGLLLGLVGIELSMGISRFTFGQVELLDGIPLVPAIVGLMGVSEILLNIETGAKSVFQSQMGSMFPTRDEVKRSVGPTLRGSLVGFVTGILPGAGTSVGSFTAYTLEQRVSKNGHKFGTGAIEGVAAPEAADNAASSAALIPLFTLGIPGSPTVAVLMGALMMHGLTPGPRLFVDEPMVVWTIIASLIIGNVMLLVLNLPLVGLWARLTRIPYRFLSVIILISAIIGTYSVRNSAFDVGLMAFFGLLGYLLTKVDVPLAPLVLALILGPLIDQALRQSLEMSQGDLGIFVARPTTLVLLILTVVVVAVVPTVTASVSVLRRARQQTE